MLKVPSHVSQFMNAFSKMDYAIYIVGGSVRDLLVGKVHKDWDFATSANPDEILKLYPNGFYNNKFGTVGITQEVDEEKHIFEVTTFRKETEYTDKRHPEKVEWAKTIEEDLARRDFTINAIAYDGENLVDPYDGQEDIKKKLVRAVGEADKRFGEDALRLIRAVRIATELEFLIEDKTRKSIEKNAGLITHISAERIRDELLRIIASDHPSEGVLFLRQNGLLRYILPEVDRCFDIAQKSPKRHHIFDVGTHLVMALKSCPSKDVITRFAALLHDIGKYETFKKDKQSGLITFYNHEVVGARLAAHIADRLKLSRAQKEKLLVLVRYHMFSVGENQTDSALRRFIKNVGRENLEEALAVRVGDRIGSGATPTSWRFELFKKRLVEVQKKPFTVADLKIDGNDVMKKLNLKPGPKVGEVLDSLFELVVEGKVKNEKQILLSAVEKLKS